MINLTHILHTEYKNKIIYFNGIYEDRYDIHGVYGYIEWNWTENKKDAIVFNTTDAWNLLHKARMEFPTCKIEVERIKTFEEIFSTAD